LDQLIISRESHQIFDVFCDLQLSEKCRKNYKMQYREFIKVSNNNDDKLLCLPCSRALKASGRNNPNTKYKSLDDNFFLEINSKEKAYLLGWIASDGHIGKRGFKIAIHQKDIVILKIFQNFICKDVSIRQFTTATSKLCSYEINSQKISKDLCKWLNIKPGKKSNSVNFPKILPEFQWDFIRGYFEGDGSINDPEKSKYPYPKGNIKSNSLSMLKDIQNICGGNGSITCNMLCLSNKQMMHMLHNMYQNNELILDRKYIRYQKWIKVIENRKCQ